MTEKEKMVSGGLYMASDDELAADFKKCRKLLRLYNATTEDEPENRKKILTELLEKTPEKIYIEPPFRCDYGCNISAGEGFYANFDCIILDVAKVTIGSEVMFGPRVGIYTACHPIDRDVRNSRLELGKPVSIGDGCWIGGDTVILPGVRIGSGAVIGAGSVVTKDIPDNVVAAGNPCRVLRPIGEKDKEFWTEQMERYYREK